MSKNESMVWQRCSQIFANGEARISLRILTRVGEGGKARTKIGGPEALPFLDTLTPSTSLCHLYEV